MRVASGGRDHLHPHNTTKTLPNTRILFLFYSSTLHTGVLLLLLLVHLSASSSFFSNWMLALRVCRELEPSDARERRSETPDTCVA